MQAGHRPEGGGLGAGDFRLDDKGIVPTRWQFAVPAVRLKEVDASPWSPQRVSSLRSRAWRLPAWRRCARPGLLGSTVGGGQHGGANGARGVDCAGEGRSVPARRPSPEDAAGPGPQPAGQGWPGPARHRRLWLHRAGPMACRLHLLLTADICHPAHHSLLILQEECPSSCTGQPAAEELVAVGSCGSQSLESCWRGPWPNQSSQPGTQSGCSASTFSGAPPPQQRCPAAGLAEEQQRDMSGGPS